MTLDSGWPATRANPPPALSQPRLRPRFAWHIPIDPDEVVRRVELRLGQEGTPCRGYIAAQQRVVDLRVLEADKHLWSPALGLQIEEDPEVEGGSIVQGLIGPEPAGWTAIAFCYVSIIAGLLFTLTLGVVQKFLGDYAWSFWIAGALMLSMVGVWWVARAGQKLAAPQTLVLRHFLEEVLQVDESQRLRTDADPYRE